MIRGVLMAGLLLAGAPAARAEIWIVLQNPNLPPQRDDYELFDKVCNLPLPSIAVRGMASASFPICGGVASGSVSISGSINIRYAGETDWTTISGLHSWSVIEAPRRPMNLRRPSPFQDED
jgi:hypothetical protein